MERINKLSHVKLCTYRATGHISRKSRATSRSPLDQFNIHHVGNEWPTVRLFKKPKVDTYLWSSSQCTGSNAIIDDTLPAIINRTSRTFFQVTSYLCFRLISTSIPVVQSIQRPIISRVITYSRAIHGSLVRVQCPRSLVSDYYTLAGQKTGNTIKTRSRGLSFQYCGARTPVLSLSGFVKFVISQSARAFPAAPRRADARASMPQLTHASRQSAQCRG